MFVAPPGYQPVYKPSIPYLGPIYGGLREGSSIYLQGATPKNITRFFINLLCGESASSDVALHFNPRFDGWDKVVFNTRQGGAWQAEDKVRSMPFSKGENFEVVIMVTDKGYQIKVSGKDFHTFPHHVPVETVRAIQIGGDVSIQTINVIGGGTGGHMGGHMGGNMGGGFPCGVGGGMGQGGYPGGGVGGGYPGGGAGQGGYPGGVGGGSAGGYPGSHLPSMAGQPVYNPPLPFSTMIPGGMFPKRTVVIRGMVPRRADRITFNFLVSRTGDVAFHMNPRVREGAVVRNSQIGGRWGQEERQLGANPFTEGQYFDMSVRCGNQRFKVFVNGQHLLDFVHRLQSFSDVDKLEISGDAQVSYVHF